MDGSKLHIWTIYFMYFYSDGRFFVNLQSELNGIMH